MGIIAGSFMKLSRGYNPAVVKRAHSVLSQYGVSRENVISLSQTGTIPTGRLDKDLINGQLFRLGLGRDDLSAAVSGLEEEGLLADRVLPKVSIFLSNLFQSFGISFGLGLVMERGSLGLFSRSDNTERMGVPVLLSKADGEGEKTALTKGQFVEHIKTAGAPRVAQELLLRLDAIRKPTMHSHFESDPGSFIHTYCDILHRAAIMFLEFEEQSGEFEELSTRLYSTLVCIRDGFVEANGKLHNDINISNATNNLLRRVCSEGFFDEFVLFVHKQGGADGLINLWNNAKLGNTDRVPFDKFRLAIERNSLATDSFLAQIYKKKC